MCNIEGLTQNASGETKGMKVYHWMSFNNSTEITIVL